MTPPTLPQKPAPQQARSRSKADHRTRSRARLLRQFDKLRRMLPWFDGWISHLKSDRAALIRLPIALVLTFGGLLSFLPLLGLWMLPAGLMLLAVDIPALQAPVAGAVIRARRWWAKRRHKGTRR